MKHANNLGAYPVVLSVNGAASSLTVRYGCGNVSTNCHAYTSASLCLYKAEARNYSGSRWKVVSGALGATTYGFCLNVTRFSIGSTRKVQEQPAFTGANFLSGESHYDRAPASSTSEASRLYCRCHMLTKWFDFCGS